MNIRKKVGKNIKIYRISADITLEELAGKLNISYVHISRLENGSYSFLNLDLILKISKILKIPFHKFFMIDSKEK